MPYFLICLRLQYMFFVFTERIHLYTQSFNSCLSLWHLVKKCFFKSKHASSAYRRRTGFSLIILVLKHFTGYCVGNIKECYSKESDTNICPVSISIDVCLFFRFTFIESPNLNAEYFYISGRHNIVFIVPARHTMHASYHSISVDAIELFVA